MVTVGAALPIGSRPFRCLDDSERADLPVVVFVAGLPGAGKTTLIDRAAPAPRWVVVDTDRLRRQLPGMLRVTPLLRLAYILSLFAAMARHDRVVVHSRGTSIVMRRLVTAMAGIRCGRSVLVLLDTPPETALGGQMQRNRVVSRRVMKREIKRWTEVRDAACGPGLRAEAWDIVLVLNRSEVAAVRQLDDLCR